MRTRSQRPSNPQRDRIVKNPIPWYTPRFWHGMRASTWLSHLARNRFAVSPAKLPAVISITGFSVLNSILAKIDQLAFSRQLAKVELAEPPVFILGHWRSGTTFLHELLIRDSRFTFPNTYQCFVPHHFVLSESWLSPLTTKLLPRRRPMDNMAAGWQRPQEDEFALGNLGVPSPYLSMMFPQRGSVYPEYLDLQDLSNTQKQAWQQAIANFFRRLAFRDNRRIVVKSPPHTARIRALLEMFPEAKFVHIVRDPYEVYASTVNLWKSLNEVQRLQDIGDMSWIHEYVMNSFERMYDAFQSDYELLSDDQLVEVRYEDLVDDPMGQLQEIYSQLDLGDFAYAETAVEGYLADVKNYHKNKYHLDETTRREVRHRWAPYIERYGYDKQPEPVAVGS